jgi:hypothetical protein
MWHARARTQKCARLRLETPKERPLGRPRRRWEDGIRMDLSETGWGVWIGFDWIRIEAGGELL